MLKLVAIALFVAGSQAFLFPSAGGGGGCCPPPSCAPPACAPQVGCSPCGGSSYGSSYGSSSYGQQSSYGYGQQQSYAQPSYQQQSYGQQSGGYATAPQVGPQISIPQAPIGGGYAQSGQQQIGGQQVQGYNQGPAIGGQAGGYQQGPALNLPIGGQQQAQQGSYQQQQQVAGPVSAPAQSQGYQEQQQPVQSTAAPVATTAAQQQGEEHAYEDIGGDHAEASEGAHTEGQRGGYKVHAAPSVNTNEETSAKCNSEALKKIILDNIDEKPAVAKRQIQAKASEELGPRIDVICSTSVFSYLVNTEIFCEAEGKGTTCLAYRQVSE